jgi:hypothetical protein
MIRTRLPNRRAGISSELEHSGATYRMQIGHYADGSPGEIFIDARIPNSALDAFAADGAILVSLLLQYGVPVDVIAHALRRTPQGEPATIMGAAVDRLLPRTRDVSGELAK